MTRSSFAGALRRAMNATEPRLRASDVALLTGTLTEGDVRDLLDARRLPTLAEVAAVSEALEVTIDALLSHQELTRGDGDE